MRIDGHILVGCFVQFDLLIGVRQVQFCEFFPTGQGYEEVLDPGDGVVVDLGCFVYCHFVVATKSDVSISLDDGDHGGSPVRELNWLNHSLALKSLQFSFNFLPESVWERPGLVELRSGCRIDMDSCRDALYRS